MTACFKRFSSLCGNKRRSWDAYECITDRAGAGNGCARPPAPPPIACALERDAYTDNLTGLGNRMGYGHAVDELWDAQAPFTVALVDLDNLKYANDAFGHDEGNHYILTVAELLRACCREGDGSGAYRIGGDEFVLISPRDTESSLTSRLEKARDELVEKSTATEPMTFSFSYGCSKVHPDEGGSRKDITADADRKMYRYKLAHRSAQQRMRNVPGAAAARGGDFNARFFTERVFEALAMAVPGRYQFVIDIESDRSRWSANAVTDLGIPSANLENTTKVWGEHVHADDLSAYLEGAGELLQGKTHHLAAQYRARDAAGSFMVCECRAFRLDGNADAGIPSLIAGVITNRSIAENTDLATGLGDIRSLMAAVDDCRYGQDSCGLLGIKVDGVAEINATLGYEAGDRALSLLVALDQELLDEVYRRVREVVASHDSSVGFLPSMGVYMLESAQELGDDCYAKASFANTQGKEHFETRIWFFRAADWKRQFDEHLMLSDFHYALRQGRIGFALQPQIVLGRGSICGAEALARWRTDDVELDPEEFIPVLERTGFIVMLDKYIWKSVVAWLRDQLRRGFQPVPISFNISPVDVATLDVREHLGKLLKSYGVPARLLKAEVPESLFLQDPDAAHALVSGLKKMGIGVFLDEFGNSLGSLALLREAGIDAVKLDQGLLVAGAEKDGRRAGIADPLLSLAREAGVSVIADDVQTERQVDALRGSGIRYIQGYVYYLPMSPADLESLLANTLLVERAGIVALGEQGAKEPPAKDDAFRKGFFAR